MGGEQGLPLILTPSPCTSVLALPPAWRRQEWEEGDPFSRAQHVDFWFEFKRWHLRYPSGTNPHLCSTASIRWETTFIEQMFTLEESGPRWCV